MATLQKPKELKTPEAKALEKEEAARLYKEELDSIELPASTVKDIDAWYKIQCQKIAEAELPRTREMWVGGEIHNGDSWAAFLRWFDRAKRDIELLREVIPPDMKVNMGTSHGFSVRAPMTEELIKSTKSDLLQQAYDKKITKLYEAKARLLKAKKAAKKQLEAALKAAKELGVELDND